MDEKEFNRNIESGEPEFFTLGEPEKGGLHNDLWNECSSIVVAFSLHGRGSYSEDRLRDLLRNVKDFEGYFRSQMKRYNDLRLEDGERPYDEEASLEAERGKLNPDLIKEYDEKISELRKLADAKKLDKKHVEKIISEEIRPIVFGKDKK